MATTAEDRVRMLSADHALDGEPVAQLGLGFRALTERAELQWHQDNDDLGPYHAAVVEVPDSGAFALVSYDEAPTESTVVMTQSGDELGDRLDALFDTLKVSPDEVIDRIDKAPPEGVSSGQAVHEAELQERLARQLEDLQQSADALRERLLAMSTLRTEELTERQRQVATLVVRGLSRREIAEQLSVSSSTVARYQRELFKALLPASRRPPPSGGRRGTGRTRTTTR
jgi:DNA-binding CsgD family transcriptional regulator